MKLKFDLHIHSNYSFDSRMSIKSILSKAKKEGLDGIAITDHNTIKGANLAEKIAKSLIIIKGEEIKTEIGEIIGLFLKEEVRPGNFLRVIKEIKKQKGIVVLPHPAEHHIITNGVIKNIDVVEVFNSRLGKEANKMGKRLAKDYNKPRLAGSDAHTVWEIGCGKTIIIVDKVSEDNLKKAILKNRTSIEGKRPDLIKRLFILFIKYWRYYWRSHVN